MSGTPNSQAVKIANQIVALSQQLISTYQQIVALDAAWTDTSAATLLAAMGTMAQNPDGSLGTPDGTPNAAHPINTLLYPVMSQAVSSTQLAQAKTILDGVRAYVEGQAVSTQVGARAILNAMING
jgi:hypothetical protein